MLHVKTNFASEVLGADLKIDGDFRLSGQLDGIGLRNFDGSVSGSFYDTANRNISVIGRFTGMDQTLAINISAILREAEMQIKASGGVLTRFDGDTAFRISADLQILPWLRSGIGLQSGSSSPTYFWNLEVGLQR